uniref:AlNc14C30G2843 protein n=1 Tax=Albugo laibachii Nc14 TaxID=890382 RepID=F0W7N9_9STRA|nr:AlNc14C30G2843 [Albugo laibachii Nc14]|eukprot:CCA17140.1 AlNc14C30G2843 [Albugo laibachii Nc14]
MEVFTTADMRSVDGDVVLLSTAQDNSDDDEPAESGATIEGVFGAHPATSIEDKLAAIRAVAFMVGDHPDLERRLMGDMRTLQQRLREKLRIVGLVLSGQIIFVLHILDACGIEHASTNPAMIVELRLNFIHLSTLKSVLILKIYK